MKYFSAFSGIGCFDYVLDPMHECVGHSEIDKFSEAIYCYHYFNKNYGNFTEIDWSSVPKFDLLVGGPPCQSFSAAGLKKGIGDVRGQLLFTFIRSIQHTKPEVVLLENVRGLLNIEGGAIFRLLLEEMDNCGYDVIWQMVNAHRYIPHNRDRLFVVGYSRGNSRTKIFPLVRETTKGLEFDPKTVGQDLSFCLDHNYYKRSSVNGYQSQRRQLILSALQEYNHNERRRNGKIYLDRSPTLTVQQGGGPKPPLSFTEYGLRQLTPIECERLMGLPDNYTRWGNYDGVVKEMSNTRRYMGLGNGVVTNCIVDIFQNLSSK